MEWSGGGAELIAAGRVGRVTDQHGGAPPGHYQRGFFWKRMLCGSDRRTFASIRLNSLCFATESATSTPVK